MAIQMRRGSWNQFDPTKMEPGEWAVILSDHPDTIDGMALYLCFAAGTVKQVGTIDETTNIIASFTEQIQEALSSVSDATEDAEDAAERAEAAIEAVGEITVLAVPLMAADTRGGAKLGIGLVLDANGRLNLIPTTVNSLGGVKVDGTTITADADGTIHGASTYVLPLMDATTRGGAKLGEGLGITDGALSVTYLTNTEIDNAIAAAFE